MLISSNLKTTPFNLHTFRLGPSQNMVKSSFIPNCQAQLQLQPQLLTSPTTHPTEKVTKSVISQLLLTQFWPNFKERFLILSWADSNCQGNLSRQQFPDNICPHQGYLICYLSDFDQALKKGSGTILNRCQMSWWHLSRQHLFQQLVKILGISADNEPMLTTLFGPNFLGALIILDQNLFELHFLDQTCFSSWLWKESNSS